jgi:hypothetical protein
MWPSSSRCRKPPRLLVDAKEGTLTLLDAGGMPFAQFPASTGSQHDPLPQGRWQVRGGRHQSRIPLQPQAVLGRQGGRHQGPYRRRPNNPVGLAWIDLSIEHYGIHGTPEPGKIGKTQSWLRTPDQLGCHAGMR